ncbi:DUF5007 domain-containing protein [Chitinophaga sp. 212800010-3]|uniref:DUF5007 domain-containing protein n=1 Tax=unclassified Chitinophaga TaxID=2619133 RepID=UPI002DE80773|nr:DUF5007 domain-containing protein [Chitinophaga sp. 212800010-3]
MERKIQTNFYWAIAGAIILLTAACRKWAPDDLDYLSPRAVYNQTVFNPILGRTTVYSLIFNTDNSTTPVHFKIMNVRYKKTGQPATDLDKNVQTLVWKQAYTGYEKSIAEIEAKRVVESHPAWEIRPNSGDFILWAGADSSFMRQQPDSGYLFDVEASNSGGTNMYKNLQLLPMREQPYSPYDGDPYTGQQRRNYPNPSDSSIYSLVYNHPGIYNITDDDNNQPLKSDSVRVLFHKKGNGNSLTFKFVDKDSLPIDVSHFNLTKWDSLLHGFNPVITQNAVTYQVAYPIPLIRLPTRFTNSDGSAAHISFSFDRLGFGHTRQTGTVDLYFGIYQKGDWEIIFYFRSNPRFRDE